MRLGGVCARATGGGRFANSLAYSGHAILRNGMIPASRNGTINVRPCLLFSQ